MRFCSFHTHTTYSYADGFGTVKEHVERVASLGMSALAISEHGNVNSHAALEQEARKAGIKSIFGIEAYFGGSGVRADRRKFHMGLYAMDDEGYRNLNAIVTQSYRDFYQYPTVTQESLKKYAKGVVAFSGCSDSLISCSLLGGKLFGEKRLEFDQEQYESARRKIEWFASVFEDRFYLEVQRFPRLDRTCVLNPAFADLSEDTGIPLIATADVHYPYPEQNKMQRILHSSRRQQTIAVADANWEYDIRLTYPTSDQEIIDDLTATGLSKSEAMRAVANTAHLSEKCNVELPKARPLRFSVPGTRDTEGTQTQVIGANITAKQYLWIKLREGWQNRCDQRWDLRFEAKHYNARLQKEMRVIAEKDFCDYFLVVADLVKWAKDNDITVGPGRGSAAGSLVCYILGITEIDPIHPTFSRMVFERFIDPSRSDMPDIDLDFDDELRHLVPERAKEIYGPDNVCNVANHIKYRGKSALNAVARVYGMPQKTFAAIGERCAIRTETDERVDDSILDVLFSYQDDPEVARLSKIKNDDGDFMVELAVELEGNQHSMGIHAGGFVIASEPIPDVCAIRTDKEVQIIPYEKRDAEYLNMLKVDFLGLTSMGMIGLCRTWTSMSLDDLYKLFYVSDLVTHELIFEKFRADDITGIFQYEGATTRQVVRDVRPETFDELAACNALSRPGPFYGGQTQEYIAVKRGEKDWERIHATGFDRHVEWTYGQIVYQEQIMWILRDLAGFPVDEVLRVRKIIGKKLGEHQFVALWDQFRGGCLSNGVSEESALRVWSSITTAAGYAFNTAHAYSYALIAWWQQWFKSHYPAVFYAASLAKNGDGKDDIPRRTALLKDAEAHRIVLVPWILDLTNKNWKPLNDEEIMPGFKQIPAFGGSKADKIIERIEEHGFIGNFKEWRDLAVIKGIGASTVLKMLDFISSDDPFGINRTENQLEAFRKQCADGEFSSFGVPGITEYASSKTLPQDNSHVAWVGIAGNLSYRDEVESIRSRTGQPADEIKAGLDDPEKTKKATLFAYDEFGEVALRVSRWRFDALQEKLAAIERFGKDNSMVVAYGRSFEDRPNSVQVTDLWVLELD